VHTPEGDDAFQVYAFEIDLSWDRCALQHLQQPWVVDSFIHVTMEAPAVVRNHFALGRQHCVSHCAPLHAPCRWAKVGSSFNVQGFAPEARRWKTKMALRHFKKIAKSLGTGCGADIATQKRSFCQKFWTENGLTISSS
jgi:hypothetical protein